MSRELMQQALEALEAGDWYIGQLEMIVYSGDDESTHEDRAKVQAAITALRTALAEPEIPPPPPEAETEGERNAYHFGWWSAMKAVREHRKPLTDEEIVSIELRLRKYVDGDRYDLSLNEFARAIEAAHGIKQEEA